MLKFFIVYKTTNLINNKYYIGVHSTYDIDDDYYGSGKYISFALKKHGKKNFKKEILWVFDNSEEMYIKEAELVTPDIVSDPQCYNLLLGGRNTFRLRQYNLEKAVIARHADPYVYVHKEGITKSILKSLEHQYLADGWQKGNLTLSKRKTGNVISQETRLKISNTLSKTFIVFKDGVHKRVYSQDELDDHINQGWVRGIKVKRRTGNVKGANNGSYGTIAMHDPVTKQRKRVKKEQVESYKANGWLLGFSSYGK